MIRKPTNEYLRTKVLTASPAELRMMLLDGAVRFAEQAHDGLVQKDYERMFEGVTRTQGILVELLNGLESKYDPELCQRLSGLYTYMYTRLVAASSQRDGAILEEVLRLLRYERETWQLLLQKVAGEPGGANGSNGAPHPAHVPPAVDGASSPAGRPRLSVQG